MHERCKQKHIHGFGQRAFMPIRSHPTETAVPFPIEFPDKIRLENSFNYFSVVTCVQTDGQTYCATLIGAVKECECT